MNEYLCAAIKRKIPVNLSSKNYKTSTLDDDDIDIIGRLDLVKMS